MSRLPDPDGVPRPWVVAYPPGVPETYELPPVAVTRFLDDAVRDFADHPAIVTDTGTIDYATVEHRVGAVAAVLGDGVAAGDRVLLALPATAVAPIAMLAVWRLGAVAVPVPATVSGDRLASIAAHARTSAAVGTTEALHALTQMDSLPSVALQVGADDWPVSSRLEWLRERGAQLAAVVNREGAHPRVRRLRDELKLLAARSTRPVPDPGADALIAYRHGESVRHALVFRHRELVAGAFQSRLWVPDVQSGRERVLLADPLPEVATLTWGWAAALLAGAATVLPDDAAAHGMARTLERSRATILSISADRLAALVTDGRALRRDLTSLRVVLVTSGRLEERIAAEMERRTAGARVRQLFVPAPASSVVAAQPVYGRLARDAVGVPVTDTRAAVIRVGAPGTLCARNEVGRLVVAGPQVAGAELDEHGSRRNRFTGGWLVTDELVTMDDDGVMRHVDRLPAGPSRTVGDTRSILGGTSRHPGREPAGDSGARGARRRRTPS